MWGWADTSSSTTEHLWLIMSPVQIPSAVLHSLPDFLSPRSGFLFPPLQPQLSLFWTLITTSSSCPTPPVNSASSSISGLRPAHSRLPPSGLPCQLSRSAYGFQSTGLSSAPKASSLHVPVCLASCTRISPPITPRLPFRPCAYLRVFH